MSTSYTHMLLRFAWLWILILPMCIQAQVNMYSTEVGAHIGGGYYVGELAPHVFVNSSEAYGAHVRYKFNDRWALKAQGIGQRVVGKNETDTICNSVWNMDLTADFNFFDFGQRDFDIYCVSPFVFLGVGCSLFEVREQDKDTTTTAASPYIPFGIGLKWKFHNRLQLQLAWQHNVHFLWNGDALEGFKEKYPLYQEEKKKNIFNNDVTSSITLSLVFEFAKSGNKNIDY